jgi:8-oxo-dGTP pyrophosphatase MutT (NUDIX family)
MSDTKSWAGGFLYNPENDSILLHLRDNKTKFNPNKYALFGGLLLVGLETPLQCFMREMKEEINLEVKQEDVIPLLNNKNIELNTQRYVFYCISDIDPKVLTLKEGAGLKWIPLKDLDAYPISKLTRGDLIYFSKSRDSK